ncbi:MAG TPA: extracellular solute-binding protein [Candidatus Mediterraneibacter vanvlietii]|nr:extracellular solute-binding protein [Candidatus Mediterraneibacter vanvlietii]
MKAKRLLSMLCVGAMTATMLAGCGGGGSDESSSSEASSGPYDEQAIENAGDITITMMVSGVATENDFETEVLPQLVKEKWPNVTLEVTKLPDDNYYTTLKSRLSSGECPDIILTQPMYAGANSCYTLAEAGYLAPLNDLKWTENMSDLAAVTYEDDIVTCTSGVSILGTYYNKDMFAECGITEEPQTWDEFLDVCETLKENGHQPIIMGDKDMYVMQFGLYQIACNEIYSQNADYDEQLRTGDTSFTDEGTWDKVLEMYNELYDKGYIDSSQTLGIGASQAIQAFIDGEAAMTFDGSFNAPALLAEGAAGAFERGYFPIPSESGDNYTATCLSAGYSIYSGSEYVDECKELLDYWFDGSSDIWQAYLATGKIIATYGEGSDQTANYDLFKPFIDMMNEGKAFHWCNQAWPSGTETTMEEKFGEMIGGQGTTVDDITQEMQTRFEDLM